MRTYDQISADAAPRSPFSNGTSGEMWMENWCYRCANDSPEMVGRGEGCPLILVAIMGGTPAEWTETGSQDYVCSGFRPRPEPGDEPEPEPEPPVIDGQIDMFEVFAEQISDAASVQTIEAAVR
jgi:hypothetical protein